MKVKDENEWIEIGNQAKKVREELFKLLSLTSGKMPKTIIRHIPKSVDHLDKFKSDAENRMFKMGDSEDLSIFYGDKNTKRRIKK